MIKNLKEVNYTEGHLEKPDLLKGINASLYTVTSPDDPEIIKKLTDLQIEFNKN